jgi:sigma-54 interacting transcriptional regulator
MSNGHEPSTTSSCDGIGPKFVCDPPVDNWAPFLERAYPVLLWGTQDATDAVIAGITPTLRVPRRRIRCYGELVLPVDDGAVILDQVDLLAPSQQVALLGWLSARTMPTQVIATTPIFLYGRVRDGLFLDDLYYRLNVIFIRVTTDTSGQQSPGK